MPPIDTCVIAPSPFLEAVRLGVAAAALNVTRRGFATGRASDIEELIGQVEVDHLPPEERGAAV